MWLGATAEQVEPKPQRENPAQAGKRKRNPRGGVRRCRRERGAHPQGARNQRK